MPPHPPGQAVIVRGINGADVRVDGSGNIGVIGLTALVPFEFDYISLSYTGLNPTTIIYKSGGALGTIVATLTIVYSGDNIVSITRS